MTLKQQLEHWEALAAKATPDWRLKSHGCVVGGEAIEYAQGKAQPQIAMFTGAETISAKQRDANAAFSAASREAVPALCAALREAVELAKRVADCGCWESQPCDCLNVAEARAFLAKYEPDGSGEGK